MTQTTDKQKNRHDTNKKTISKQSSRHIQKCILPFHFLYSTSCYFICSTCPKVTLTSLQCRFLRTLPPRDHVIVWKQRQKAVTKCQLLTSWEWDRGWRWQVLRSVAVNLRVSLQVQNILKPSQSWAFNTGRLHLFYETDFNYSIHNNHRDIPFKSNTVFVQSRKGMQLYGQHCWLQCWLQATAKWGMSEPVVSYANGSVLVISLVDRRGRHYRLSFSERKEEARSFRENNIHCGRLMSIAHAFSSIF